MQCHLLIPLNLPTCSFNSTVLESFYIFLTPLITRSICRHKHPILFALSRILSNLGDISFHFTTQRSNHLQSYTVTVPPIPPQMPETIPSSSPDITLPFPFNFALLRAHASKFDLKTFTDLAFLFHIFAISTNIKNNNI